MSKIVSFQTLSVVERRMIPIWGMVADMDSIAIITARSGSKGLKDKNIKLLAGRPLIAYTIDAALNSKLFSEVMVSTDSEKYAWIAKDLGAEVPFLRSKETSTDSSGSWDVVREVLAEYEKRGRIFDSVCLLQPTSPLRSAEDIVNAYRLFEEKRARAVTGVCLCDHPAEYMMRLDESFSLDEFRKNLRAGPRQIFPVYYRLNGAVFIRSVEYRKGEILIADGPEYAFVMDRDHSVDIDTSEDFEYAEFLMTRRGQLSYS